MDDLKLTTVASRPYINDGPFSDRSGTEAPRLASLRWWQRSNSRTHPHHFRTMVSFYSAKRTIVAARSQKSRILCKIPVEIWHEILDLATTIEDGDEFGQSDISSSTFLRPNHHITCYISLEEQRMAFQNRRNVILVCQAWYAIALQFLWAHVRVDGCEWVSKPSRWSSSLQSDVWLKVRRLDITYSDRADCRKWGKNCIRSFQAFLANQIFPRVSQLHILCAPHDLATGRHSLRPRVVILHPMYDLSPDWDSSSEEGYTIWAGATHFWTTAHVLDLDFDMAHLSEQARTSSQEGILFPELVKLCIRSITSDSIISYITSTWKTPLLRMLVLQVVEANMETWLPLLAWAGETIECVHLATFDIDEGAILNGSLIHLPHLTSLTLEHCFCTSWTSLFSAPLLTYISFSDASMDILHRRHRSKFAAILTHALDSFPACTYLSFYGSEQSQDDHDADVQVDSSAQDPGLRFSINPTNPAERALAVEHGWLMEHSS
jgi:hypothetical protein